VFNVFSSCVSRYMDDAVILEEGTHDELIKKGGGYAKIWMLQAQAFLP
jgi:ABC-type multidrug transport system fused ATPase/permease subunit